MTEKVIFKASEKDLEMVNNIANACKLLFEGLKALKTDVDAVTDGDSEMTQLVGNAIGVYYCEIADDYRKLIEFMHMITTQLICPLDILKKLTDDYPDQLLTMRKEFENELNNEKGD